MAITLWHIPLSHYNEKARWALDHKRVPHRRRTAPTGLYGLYAAVLTRGRNRRLPLLDLDGHMVWDSTAIIAALEERAPEPALYPTDPAERERALALEDFFDEELAPAVRTFAWHEVFRERGFASALAPDASPRTRRALDTVMAPLAEPFMRRDYAIDDERAAAARRAILAAMDRLEAELQPSGYLVGDGFSVADLAAASLFTPLLCPPQRPHQPAATPAAVLELRAELEARPGGRWVHETYARHR